MGPESREWDKIEKRRGKGMILTVDDKTRRDTNSVIATISIY
jgi:hypothetical protein